ncbi:MAG: nucleotidyltransferase domain-containing protein [Candidatus Baldrarchaeia archaeon]
MRGKWIPRDGDVVISRDNIIFYVFGYSHPANRVIAYPKYIPENLVGMFDISFLKSVHWKFSGISMYRPRKLFSPDVYVKELSTFTKKLPEYVYHCIFSGKLFIAVPRELIKYVYVPEEGLKRLICKREKDDLERRALQLIELLSTESSVDIEDFGIHGSILLGMHRKGSDIDIAVYGAENYRRVRNALEKLHRSGELKIIFEDDTDLYRKNKGLFLNTKFVVNAIRKYEEIKERYGKMLYHAIHPVKFVCKIKDARESVFRPAIYKISLCDIRPDVDAKPEELVSMIGAYRGYAREGDIIYGVGMLEKVYNTSTGDEWWRIVIGSGIGEEYICHAKNFVTEMRQYPRKG